MTEILFYHFQRQTLEAVLPPLIQKSLDRGWRVVVQGTTEERIAMLDDILWTYADDSFLAHGRDDEPSAAENAVVLTVKESNVNGASIRFLIEGALFPADAERYQRIVLLFDGNDEDAVQQARLQWKDVKAKAFEATYWQQGDRGQWEKKG